VAYDRILASGLRSPEVETRGRAVKRWAVFVVAWQALVVAAAFAYAFWMTHGGARGLVWVAPIIAALLGTALPLQLAVMRLMRAVRE
jgi:hypothetical protein